MQCFLLLEGLNKYSNDFFTQIIVCYEGSTSDFKLGYDKLTSDKKFDKIKFVPKTRNHYEDFSLALDGNFEYFSIMTDDSIFYRQNNLLLEQLNEIFEKDILAFSFRLGLNTNIIDFINPTDKMSIDGKDTKHDLIKFYWPNHTSHAAHIFALDSTIMKMSDIKTLVQRACSPTGFSYRSLECKCMEYLRMNPNKPFALCQKLSCLVNSPNNMCTLGIDVRNGVKHKYTLEDLNQKWLDDYKIDINNIDKDSIVSVQQEIPFTFIKQ